MSTPVVTLDPASTAVSAARDCGGAGPAQRVTACAQRGHARVTTSVVYWGEVIGRIEKFQGKPAADAFTTTMKFYGLEIIESAAAQAAKAAGTRVELAASFQNYLIETADLEFLPAKPNP